MARRKARIPQGKKIQPAQLTISTSMNGKSKGTLDLSQCASLLNRRFYRQGLNWAVSGFTFLTEDPAQSGFIGVQKIPDTWVSSNSWEKGFRAWQKMNNDALDEAESVKPRFLDFKVFMDSDHHAVGEGANLLPFMGSPSTALTVGEWEYSKYVVPFGPSVIGYLGTKSQAEKLSTTLGREHESAGLWQIFAQAVTGTGPGVGGWNPGY